MDSKLDDFYFLNEAEKERISSRFLEDPVLVEAVRKVILSGIYSDGVLEKGRPADPLKNFIVALFTRPQIMGLPSEKKGQLMETVINAVSIVESGFDILKKLKKVEPIISPIQHTGR